MILQIKADQISLHITLYLAIRHYTDRESVLTGSPVIQCSCGLTSDWAQGSQTVKLAGECTTYLHPYWAVAQNRTYPEDASVELDTVFSQA